MYLAVTKFQVFTVVTVQTVVYRAVVPSRSVNGYLCCGRTCFLHLHDRSELGNRVLCTVPIDSNLISSGPASLNRCATCIYIFQISTLLTSTMKMEAS
jgi:hypothetical protein